jgi:hypothetical protein
MAGGLPVGASAVESSMTVGVDAQSDHVRCDVVDSVTVTSVTSEINVLILHRMTSASKT